jgi:hypothetical protein
MAKQQATVQLNVKTDKAEQNLSQVNKKTESVKGNLDGVKNAADSATGGMISGFTGALGSVRSLIGGFGGLRVAIASTGIGALVLAITSLIQAFKTSEEGQDRFSKLMTQIGTVVGNVTDILTDFGNGIINAGKSLFRLASGDIKGAREAFNDLKGNINDATDAIVNFGEETAKELEIAAKIADKRAKADKEERKLILERAEADREIARLREIAADKEGVAVEERIAAIKEAGDIEARITKQEIEAARLRFEAKQAENELANSTKEDLDEEAQLKANLIQLETARLKLQKTLTAEITTALREQETERKAIEAQRKAEEKEAQKEALDFQKKLDEEEKKRKEQIEKETKERNDRIAKSEEELAARTLAAKQASINGIINLFGAESKAGRAALIAKEIMAAKEMIIEAKKTLTFSSLAVANSSQAIAQGTAQTAKIGFPQNIPMLIAYALQAVGIIGAVKSAVSKAKGVASKAGAGGGSIPEITAPRTSAAAVSQPPAFNIVGASGVNQLAEVVGQQATQPVKAFVVSKDVTTSQELDRNIVKGASLG